jgi:hypothetical protein
LSARPLVPQAWIAVREVDKRRKLLWPYDRKPADVSSSIGWARAAATCMERTFEWPTRLRDGRLRLAETSSSAAISQAVIRGVAENRSRTAASGEVGRFADRRPHFGTGHRNPVGLDDGNTANCGQWRHCQDGHWNGCSSRVAVAGVPSLVGISSAIADIGVRHSISVNDRSLKLPRSDGTGQDSRMVVI